MSIYKALIVEDELWARVSLRDKLSIFPEIEIVGEAGSIADAKNILKTIVPNVIFLDIQLSDGTGFDLLNQVEYSGKVIFVTAFDEFAIRAFEINALDYIMKPISEKRLEAAIKKINISTIPPQNDFNNPLKIDDRIMVSFKNSINFIKISEIVLITAAQDYSTVITLNMKEFLVSKTMNEWELRLPEQSFCRIHRSYIINFECIEKFIKTSSNSANIFLKGHNDPFKVSRSFYHKIKKKYK